ncbi:MAG: hypothetical protein Q7S05_01370 [bacterium]|nr:hypothetical protein [bacterium]
MSTTNKWVVPAIIIIAIVLGYLWWSGRLGTSPASQSAAAANSTAGAAENSDATIAQDVVSIDAQIQGSATALSLLDKNSPQSSISGDAVNLNSLVSAMSKVAAKLGARVSGATGLDLPEVNALTSQVKNLNAKLLTASSAVANANNELAGIKAGQTANNAAAIQKAESFLVSALSTARSAREDIQTLAQAVKSQ